MKDITTKEDIKLLIDAFYQKAIDDKEIGYFFTEVAQLNFKKHMPIMYRFWEATLLGKPGYMGNPMEKHLELNKKSPLQPKHFDRWLFLWEKTVKENFEGTIADEAIQRAKNIAGLMLFKIQQTA